MTQPALFGISRSNRDFSDPYYWGKNQFNSSFPVALACYMRSRAIPLVYIRYEDEQGTITGEMDVADVFGTNRPNEDLYFSFETRFDPFITFVHDELPLIDLVVCIENRQRSLRPLEIKLTTLPDNTTSSLSENQYGTELVIRDATTRYMALSMTNSLRQNNQMSRVRKIFEPVLARIRNWDSVPEMIAVSPHAIEALSQYLNEFKHLQTPLLLQPIWKTIGKSSVLAENCLDIFVWSDFALTHLFFESALNSLNRQGISRQLRAALRLSRFIYQSSMNTAVYQAPIYDGMTYDNQNDKEFAISGTKSRRLMSCERLSNPIVTKSEIKNIVLGGGQKYLSPERRFDAILYFSNELFDE